MERGGAGKREYLGFLASILRNMGKYGEMSPGEGQNMDPGEGVERVVGETQEGIWVK